MVQNIIDAGEVRAIPLQRNHKFCFTMPRTKGDGRGRLGGRQPGTPNKDKPLKTFLRQHSIEYFTPSIEEAGEDGKPTGRLISPYDIDIRLLDPASRVEAELKLLKFHTPQMQSTSVDMTLADVNQTISERLARLAAGEHIDSPAEE